MRRFLSLLIFFSLAMPACSGGTPTEPQVQLTVAKSMATTPLPIFQQPAVSATSTPTPVVELDSSFQVTVTVTLTATPTLTPTLTTGAILTPTGISTQPPLLPTVAPKKSPFLKREKGPEPCG